MELVRVDFPGYIKDSERAVGLLGGDEGISNGLSSNPPSLRLRLRSSDPFSSGLSSEPDSTPSIYLRMHITRTYRVVDGRRVLVRTEVVPEYVGRSRCTHSFRQPADFQFVPPVSGTALDPTVNSLPHPRFVFVPPPRFLQNYHYTASHIRSRLFGPTEDDVTKVWQKGRCVWIVSHNGLLSNESGPARPGPSPEASDDLVSYFEDLFDRRPIWTTISIFDTMVSQPDHPLYDKFDESSAVFFRSLAQVAYYVRSGPFIMCWVRYGLNPVFDRSLSRYQTILISLRELSKECPSIQRKLSNSFGHTLKTFPRGFSKLQTLPNRLNFPLQLVDLEDEFVRSLILDPLPRYNPSSGWFDSDLISCIRRFVLLKIKRMSSKGSGNIDPNIIMKDVVTLDDLHQTLKRESEREQKSKSASSDIHYDFQLLSEISGILNDGNSPVVDDVNSGVLFDRFLSLSFYSEPVSIC